MRTVVTGAYGQVGANLLAAVISITGDPTGSVRRVNAEGPRNAAQAALACGVSRFIRA